jgi:hypothetical protein
MTLAHLDEEEISSAVGWFPKEKVCLESANGGRRSIGGESIRIVDADDNRGTAGL